MNDEGRPGNRSVETADYLAGARFGADSDVWDDTDSSDDSELEETGSFSPGSVRFSSPAAEFPPARDFSLGSSDFSAESGFSADSTSSADYGSNQNQRFDHSALRCGKRREHCPEPNSQQTYSVDPRSMPKLLNRRYHILRPALDDITILVDVRGIAAT